MKQIELQEQVLSAWIWLNGTLKDSRMTKDMTYNEAVVMRIVLEKYRADGTGLTPVKQIISETNMLKSQANRTINTLCAKGFLYRKRDEKDARNLYVAPIPEKMPDFIRIHKDSLQMVQAIIEQIGEEDARHFVRICNKLAENKQNLINIKE